jgi:pimeloyl-ACP methyl ester carboxylesterase
VQCLEALGHRASTVQLPSEDPSAGCSRYAEVVIDALPDSADGVVLVGHSLGGITIPLVAAARPVQRLVFLAALMPEPQRSLDDQLRDEPGMVLPALGAALERDAQRTWVRDSESAIRLFYHDCSPDLGHAAATRLRPQARAPFREPCPLVEWPQTETVYIACQEDRVVNPEWAREAAERQSCSSVVEIPGGHSPFLSRPRALAHLLAGYG